MTSHKLGIGWERASPLAAQTVGNSTHATPKLSDEDGIGNRLGVRVSLPITVLLLLLAPQSRPTQTDIKSAHNVDVTYPTDEHR